MKQSRRIKSSIQEKLLEGWVQQCTFVHLVLRMLRQENSEFQNKMKNQGRGGGSVSDVLVLEVQVLEFWHQCTSVIPVSYSEMRQELETGEPASLCSVVNKRPYLKRGGRLGPLYGCLVCARTHTHRVSLSHTQKITPPNIVEVVGSFSKAV